VLYRNEKSSRESDTCGSTGFTENKQRERRDRTEMDQAAGATDQLLLESKSHGTKNARRERERGYGHEQQGERPRTTLASCACKNNEDHDRPRRAVPCRADEQATWASRASTARTGFTQIKERLLLDASRARRWLRRGAARHRAGLQRCGCEGHGQELHCHSQHRTGAPTWRPSTKNRTLRTARGASEKSKQSRPKHHDSFPNFAQMKFSLVQTYP